MTKLKAVGLFSGGLDSLLAIRLIQDQNIEVFAVSFCSPFFIANEEKKNKLEKAAKENNFHLKFIEFGKDYLKIVKQPKHGHGKNMNPCIDCHAFMLKKAKAYAKEIDAKFIFTGEVLDERPMSQNKRSLDIVAEDSGLKGKLLRPLSAKLLPETEAEKQGIIKRENLLDIKGRSRKRQLDLAKRFNITEFETPGGGCLLTYQEYSNKLKDLLKSKKQPDFSDIKLLNIGRHFRKNKNKIVVGRNKKDNDLLSILKNKQDYIFEAKSIPGPLTILQGPKTKEAIILAASLTARYSDSKEDKVIIKYGKGKFNKEIRINKIEEYNIRSIRI